MRRLMIFIVLTSGCGQSAYVAADGPAPAKQSGRKLALLVGVTKYDFLEVKQLTGPGNDVLLMRKTLKDQFHFADKDIVILADRPEAAARPTRANIKSHFDRLAKEAMPDDQIVILFGGHGDQQPDQEPFDEPDGLDQIFLPCDAIKESPDAKAIKNAIIDDEVDVWTKAITDRGASLWMIFDCCHSATMLRGSSDEVSRSVPPGTLISIAAINEAKKLAASRQETTRSGDSKAPAKKPENKTPKLVAIYACERNQETPELTAPQGGTERHGLLTYTICEVLTKAKSKLTYKELVDRVRAKYVAEWNKPWLTPLVDGVDQDAEVLGANSWTGRSRFLLDKVGDDWKIRAGQLHGLTAGSILAVHPPAGEADADKIVGHVRIKKSEAAESEVEPCEYEKSPLTKELPTGGRCVPVYMNYGSMRLRVGIEDGAKADDRVRPLLAKLATMPESMFELVGEGHSADVVVRVKGEKLVILATDIAKLPDDPKRGAAVSMGEPAKIQEAFTKIARALNLLKLVGRESSGIADSDLQVEMLRFQSERDREGRPIEYGPKGAIVKPGDLIGWRVKNTGRNRAVFDVTLLYIDSQYGIDAIFPERGQGGSNINRVFPNSEFIRGPLRVDDNTFGLEHLVLIAVKGEGPPIDFTVLAQPKLDATRGAKAPDTRLGRMLESALFANGATRSVTSVVVQDPGTFRLLPLTVAPKR